MTAEKVLEIARGEIGVKESPYGSNKVKYNTEFYGSPVAGTAYPWCVAFVWWVFKQAGASSLFYGGKKTASCTVLNTYHQGQGQGISGGYRPGDIIFFNFSGGRSTDHVGICESWDGATITTIDGNTGTGNEANGGAVMRRSRSKRYIVAAYRPAYEQEEEKMEMDNSPSAWAKEAVEWAQEQGLLKGDQYGNLQLHKEMTREEMCVFLYRFSNN